MGKRWDINELVNKNKNKTKGTYTIAAYERQHLYRFTVAGYFQEAKNEKQFICALVPLVAQLFMVTSKTQLLQLINN